MRRIYNSILENISMQKDRIPEALFATNDGNLTPATEKIWYKLPSTAEKEAIQKQIDDFKKLELIKEKLHLIIRHEANSGKIDYFDESTWSEDCKNYTKLIPVYLSKASNISDLISEYVKKNLDIKTLSTTSTSLAEFKVYYKNYVAPLSSDELLKICNFKTTTVASLTSPIFLLPDGKFIDVSENLSINPDFSLMHTDIVWEILSRVFNYLSAGKFDFSMFYKNLDNSDRYELDLPRSLTTNLLYHLTDDLGWIKLNGGGSLGVDDRFYCVFPDYSTKVTSAQYESVLKFLDEGYQKNKNGGVLVYCGARDSLDTATHYYSFISYTTEEIVQKVKRFYSSGILYENAFKIEDASKRQHTNLNISSVLDAIKNTEWER